MLLLALGRESGHDAGVDADKLLAHHKGQAKDTGRQPIRHTSG